MEAVTVAIVIITVLLLILFITFSPKLKGGNYVGINQDDGILVPSLSQIVMSNASKVTSFDRVILDAAAILYRNSRIKFNHDETRISYMYENQRVSDANIDLYGIDDLIVSGFAANEWNAKTKKPEVNSLITFKNVEIYAPIIKYNDYAMIKSKSIQYQKTEIIPDVKIYIEFSYYSLDNMEKAYVNIHNRTRQILRHILRFKHRKPHIYVVRCFIYNNGDLFSEDLHFRILQFSNFSFTYYDEITEEDEFNTVVIPKSQHLKYDEVLVFEDVNGIKYNCQIEHSEEFNHHKSNLFEFIVRTVKPFSKGFKRLVACLDKMKYHINSNSKYNVTFKKGVDKNKNAFRDVYPEFYDKFILQ